MQEMSITTLVLLLNTTVLMVIAAGIVAYVLSNQRRQRAVAWVANKVRREPVIVANAVAFLVNGLVLADLVPVETSARAELIIIGGVMGIANLIARNLVSPTTPAQEVESR